MVKTATARKRTYTYVESYDELSTDSMDILEVAESLRAPSLSTGSSDGNDWAPFDPNANPGIVEYSQYQTDFASHVEESYTAEAVSFDPNGTPHHKAESETFDEPGTYYVIGDNGELESVPDMGELLNEEEAHIGKGFWARLVSLACGCSDIRTMVEEGEDRVLNATNTPQSYVSEYDVGVVDNEPSFVSSYLSKSTERSSGRS